MCSTSLEGVHKTRTPLLDPPLWTPSGPLNFSVTKEMILNLSYTQYVCYIPLLLSHFSFRRFSVQLEEGFPFHATYFKVLV